MTSMCLGKLEMRLKGLGEALLATANRIRLEVNEAKTEYLVVTWNRQNDSTLDVSALSFKNIAEYPYFGSLVTSDNYTNDGSLSESKMVIGVSFFYVESFIVSPKGLTSAYNAVIVTYGCETWNLTVRIQQRFLVFKNRVLRIILGPKEIRLRIVLVCDQMERSKGLLHSPGLLV